MSKPKSDKTRKAVKPATTPERLNAIGIEAICDYIAKGDSLNSWAKLNELPIQTITDWIDADTSRAGKYAKARDKRSESVFEALDDICMDALAESRGLNSGPIVAAYRLKVDTIKWKLARMTPKKYGEKIEIAGDPDAPLITRIERVIIG